MKKITLLVASIFLIGSGVANATERNITKSPVDFRNADPIVFSERGVEFYVFADGQFDFNTTPSNGDMYYKQGRRTSAVNKTYGTPASIRNGNYGVKIEHDYEGRVRRIGNVFINYDANDRIKRVGSVYMTYNRFALTQVGGLQIIYNRRGQIVDIFGSVKGGRGYQYYQNNNNGYDNDYDYDNDQNSGNQDDIYYRSNGSKGKKEGAKATGSLDARINS
jgi:hypothetical protein